MIILNMAGPAMLGNAFNYLSSPLLFHSLLHSLCLLHCHKQGVGVNMMEACFVKKATKDPPFKVKFLFKYFYMRIYGILEPVLRVV